MGGNSATASEETLSDGHFDDMRGTIMNHLQVVERDQMERGACKKMFMTIEPYTPKQPFRYEIKEAQE